MRNYIQVNRLHRNTVQAKVSGVCAGLADYWGQPRWLIRLAAIIALLMLPVVTGVAYALAVLLLPTRP